MGLNMCGSQHTIYFQIVWNVIHSWFAASSAQEGVNHCLHQRKLGQASKHFRWHYCHWKKHPSCFPPSFVLQHHFCAVPPILHLNIHTKACSNTDHQMREQGPNWASITLYFVFYKHITSHNNNDMLLIWPSD